MSGGLDSQLAEKVLQRAGAEVEPVAAIPELKCEDDRLLAQKLVDAYAKGTSETDRLPYKPYQIF